MKIARKLVAFSVFLAVTLSLASKARGNDGGRMQVGGLEPVQIDGHQYFFAYDFREDRVLSPLLSRDAAIQFAVANLAQRDGRHSVEFWAAHADASLADPSLTDASGQKVALGPFLMALTSLRQDVRTTRRLSDITVPDYLSYLLEINCEWPDVTPPRHVELAVVRLGLEIDDQSPWLQESTGFLSGEAAAPPGATFEDAATVFLWYFDTLVRHQRHGWAEQLGLTPGAA